MRLRRRKRGTLILFPPFSRGVRGDRNAVRQLDKTCMYNTVALRGERLKKPIIYLIVCYGFFAPSLVGKGLGLGSVELTFLFNV
jgi:hypothetical protein